MAQSQAVQKAPKENGHSTTSRYFSKPNRLDGWLEAAVLELRAGYGGQRLSLVLELRLYVYGWPELRERGIHSVLPIALLGRVDHS